MSRTTLPTNCSNKWQTVIKPRAPLQSTRWHRLTPILDLINTARGVGTKTEADRIRMECRALAKDPDKRIEAISMYHNKTGCGLPEARFAILGY